MDQSSDSLLSRNINVALSKTIDAVKSLKGKKWKKLADT